MEDINRGSIPAEKATEIITGAITQSAVMSLARKVDLPGNGKEIKVLLSDAIAGWVTETDKKKVSTSELATKTLKPATLAYIEPFSNEFRRDYNSIYNQIVARGPSSLAKAFDRTVIGAVTAPDSNFDTLSGAADVAVDTGTYAAIVGAVGAIADEDGEVNGIAGSPKLQSIFLSATDTTGRPIFIPSAQEGSKPSVLALPTAYSSGMKNPTAKVVGAIGDWSKAVYGMTGQIDISVTEQASLELEDGSIIHLWQQNMFAVRVEVALGFVVADKKYFRLLKTA